jgi:hypothetical protein
LLDSNTYCERKKLKASLDGFNLVAPLYGIKRVDDNVYALSPTTKKQAGSWDIVL